MSSARNSVSADSAWVATVSNIFEERRISATSPLIAPSLISLAMKSLYVFGVELSRRRAKYLFTFFLLIFFFFFFFSSSPSPSPSPSPFSSFSVSFSLASLFLLFLLFLLLFIYFASSVQQDKSVDVQDKSVDVSQANPPKSEHSGIGSRPMPTSAGTLRPVRFRKLRKERENIQKVNRN